jgi:ABC-2 type transport system ATP-binding protein
MVAGGVRLRREEPGVSAAVVTRGLTKRFGPVTAVEDLDIEVAQGEVFGFLGPNGAGKTTTIRLLLDVLRPTSGSAEVLGGSPGDLGVRARIGFLPAELQLDPRHTADDAITFLGALRGGFRGAEVGALLERFDLDPGRRIGELSTGNRRKVGVVQAFAGHPELLILDEPTSGLDPLLQHELQSLVEERVADGATVFLSSHVLPEVERVADRIGILRRGRLVALGTVDEVRATARHRLDLHLGAAADPAPFHDLPGVVDAVARGDVLVVTVEGSVDAVVKQAAQLEVRRIVSHDGDLEEAFRELYR